MSISDLLRLPPGPVDLAAIDAHGKPGFDGHTADGKKALPTLGQELAEPDEIERRYGAINEWERRLAATGTTMVKCMLHISADKQRERLLARLDDPTKQWKFKPTDVDERGHWDEYQAAYATALDRC